MATTIAILVGETEKAYRLICGRPATMGWVAKSLRGVSRPQHLFYVRWPDVSGRKGEKVYQAVEISVPSWLMKEKGWTCPIGTAQTLARFKTELASLPAVNPETPEEADDLDKINTPWWNRD